jgi:serine/threonine protein phosphatase PrpC
MPLESRYRSLLADRSARTQRGLLRHGHPAGAELENKGLIAAVADGIGGHKGGREAAEYTVRGLLSDYYATPDTWSVPHALEKVVVPLNRWVMAEAAGSPTSPAWRRR